MATNLATSLISLGVTAATAYFKKERLNVNLHHEHCHRMWYPSYPAQANVTGNVDVRGVPEELQFSVHPSSREALNRFLAALAFFCMATGTLAIVIAFSYIVPGVVVVVSFLWPYCNYLWTSILFLGSIAPEVALDWIFYFGVYNCCMLLLLFIICNSELGFVDVYNDALQAIVGLILLVLFSQIVWVGCVKLYGFVF